MQPITSRENAKVKFACLLAASPAFRAQQGLFFAEGVRLCLDLAALLPPVQAFFTREVLQSHPRVAQLAGEGLLVEPHVADKLAQTKATQGLFMVFRRPQHSFEDMDLQRGVLLCEDVADPANMGAILRAAAGLGLGGAVLAGSCADPFSPRALRAGMGAAARLALPVYGGAAQAAARLKSAGATLYAAALKDALPLPGLRPRRPFALMLGNEGRGLGAAALAMADERVCIPMQGGVESLNVAAAAAVLAYHFKNACEWQ